MSADTTSPADDPSAGLLADHTPTRTVIVVSAACVGIGQGFARFTFGVLLPAMTDDLIGSYGRAGWLGTANLAAYLVGMVLVSAIAARVHPVTIVRWALTGTISGLFVLAVAPSMAFLLLGMILSGGCAAGLWVPLAGIVSGVAEPHRRGIALGLVVSGVGVGILASGQLVALLRSIVGEGAWREVWALEGVVGLVVLAFVVRLLKPGRSAGREEAAPVRLTALLAVPRWWAITGLYTLFGFAYSLYVNYLVAALETDAGFSSVHAARLYSLLGTTSIVGGVLFGRWSDRIGRRAALLVGIAAIGGCALVVPLGREPWAALSAALFGLAMTGSGTVVSAVFSDHLDPREVASAFGMVTILYGITQAAAPYAGGQVAELSGGFSAVFLASAATFGLCAAFAWWVPKRPAAHSSASG